MKRIVFIFSLVLIFSVARSQILVEETKTWNNVECLNFGGCWTYTDKIIGDTIIDSVEYKKLYSISDSLKKTRGLYGAIREADNKVYLFNFHHDNEYILYDFNLTVGDRFYTNSSSHEAYGCPIILEVNSIDTITLLNGEQRRRFNFGWQDTWIEGIGSLNGILNVGIYWCVIDVYYYLSCCHVNGEKIYQSSSFDHCYIYTVGQEEIKEQTKPNIAPNPFNNSATLRFEYSNSNEYRLQVFNLFGQLILESQEIISNEIKINGEYMKPGIYFYKLTENDRLISNGKLIKK